MPADKLLGPDAPGRFRYFHRERLEQPASLNSELRPDIRPVGLILSDFDGLEVRSELMRQRALLITARKPQWVSFFGSREALDEISGSVLRSLLQSRSPRSIFEDTIGAPERDFASIIKDVARVCCEYEQIRQRRAAFQAGGDPSAISVAFNEEAFDCRAFKKDRDALVNEAVKSGWLRPNTGLAELYNYARWAEIPLCIVTQSKRTFVEAALRKIFGDDFSMPTIVSKEDLDTFQLSPKPDPQPYRFGAILMTLRQMQDSSGTDDGQMRATDLSLRQTAAELSVHKLDSEALRSAAISRLGDRAFEFLRLLPAPDSCLVLEDSEKGARAGREMSVALISNGVCKLSHQLAKPPNEMNPEETQELDRMIASLREEGIPITLAGHDLRAVVDYVRISNPISGSTISSIVSNERDPIDLESAYRDSARMLARTLGVPGCERILLTGAFRSVDSYIVSRLAKISPFARILDAGCGTSIPLFRSFDGVPKPSSNYSSPILARVLALRGYEVVAIDQESERLAHDGELLTGALIAHGRNPAIFSGHFRDLGLDLRHAPTSPDTTSSIRVVPGHPLYADLQGIYGAHELPTFSIHPLINAQVERELFGLKAFGDIDLTDLNTELQHSVRLRRAVLPGFDLIFTRNMPADTDLGNSFLPALLPHLREGGLMIAEVSKSILTRDPNHWSPSRLSEDRLAALQRELPRGYSLTVAELNDADVVVISR